MQIYSFSPFGYEGSLVTVEVDLRRGIPAIDLVGLADGAVKEARERMQAAIRNSGFDFPPERILISLSPADLKKEGAGFDLPIALGVLAAKTKFEEAPASVDFPVLIMGELELSGKVRPVRGVHAAAATAASAGIMHCIVPTQNADEAREVAGIKVFGAENLQEAFEALSNPEVFTEHKAVISDKKNEIPEGFELCNEVLFKKSNPDLDFTQVKGQQKLVRALQIAAAGGHNFIAVGAPGCGKTMCIQRISELLPALTLEEAQPVTRILSLAGLLSPKEPLVRLPQVRMPHQTASIEGICGGGVNCRPGEISLAHNGVLFLDEAAEFRSSVLQMLRVPLESKSITISRAGRSTVFPANFQLMMAANPCPCGNYGSDSKICLCSARSIELYWKKFSGPLLDRIDIRVFVKNENTNAEDRDKTFSTRELRKEIANAVLAQRKRQAKKNASLSPSEISDYCVCTTEARKYLDDFTERSEFSPRAAASCLKTARTIADMAMSEKIELAHMTEAAALRKPFADFMNLDI